MTPKLKCVASPLEIAHKYTALGWSVIPIPSRQKAPQLPGWNSLRLGTQDLGRYFTGGPQNIGVLLGKPSGWLVDIDLDHALAVELAEQHLPKTNAIFGRLSNLRSHWLYYLTEPLPTQKWQSPQREMIVELRSTGCQTVFPGSVHPSGESIDWELEGTPSLVNSDHLLERVNSLYKAVCEQLGIAREVEQPHSAAPSPSAPSSSAPERILRRARGYLAKLPPAVSGQGGHNATFKAACTLVIGFGLDRQQAMQLLSEWNEQCVPPWSAAELEHKIDDALQQPGWRGYLLDRASVRQSGPTCPAIARANRHALEHRLKARRRSSR